MTDHFWVILAGSLVALMGITGISNKTRRGRWSLRMFGEIGNRIFYIIMGVAFIVLGLVIL